MYFFHLKSDNSFEMVIAQFESLINIKIWSNGHKRRGIIKYDNPNREAQVYL